MKVCEHRAVRFPTTKEAKDALRHFSADEIKQGWPRFSGACSCGFNGIAYASHEHYIYGDW